jgi:hypothetical protein
MSRIEHNTTTPRPAASCRLLVDDPRDAALSERATGEIRNRSLPP